MKASYYFAGYKVSRSVMFAAGVAAMAAGLAACDRKPEGQVVATVNGDEITTEELNVEIPASVAPGDADQSTRNAALQKVIDRLLLARVAEDEGIDSSPEFILREKKLKETLLVQMLNEKLAREIKDPTAGDVDKMIADNPQAFRDRTVFALDQIVFAAPKRSSVLNALVPTKTMDDVVTVLNRAGIKFQRGNTTVDSATLPPAMFNQFQKVGASEPMIIPSGSSVAVAKILAARPVPMTGVAARPLAGAGYKREQTQLKLKSALKNARNEAKISYQSGYGAPVTDPAPKTTSQSAEIQGASYQFSGPSSGNGDADK